MKSLNLFGITGGCGENVVVALIKIKRTPHGK
jgi:hypothetical protein